MDEINLFSEYGWALYLIMGFLLSMVEIFVPSFFCLPVGLAAIATAPFAFFLPPWASLMLWGGFSSLAYLGFRKFARKGFRRRLQTGVQGLVGQSGHVIEAIDPATQAGRVKVMGDDWGVFGMEEAIPEGASVRILEFQGNRIRVEAMIDVDAELHQQFERKLKDAIIKSN